MDLITLDLTALANRLIAEATQTAEGRQLRPLALEHTTLRMTGIGLAAGAELPPHENPGEAALQVLHGRVRLVALGADDAESASKELVAGQIGRIPDSRHRVAALEPSALLLTALPLPLTAPPTPLTH